MVDRGAVRFGEIHHVEVIANAGAIRSRVVRTKNAQARSAAGGHLGDERKQIVGYAEWVLADPTTRMSSHRIEVAQAGDTPAALAAEGLQHLLHRHLGLGIGVDWGRGGVFSEWELLGLSVDGCGAAEHHGAAVVPFHRSSQHTTAVEIDVPVQQWVGHRLAHCLEAGEVNHPVDGSMARESPVDRFWIADVPFQHLQLLTAAELFHPFQSLW